MMLNPIRKLSAMVLGNYIVLESLHYGLRKRHRRIGRFASLRKAKAFAKAESARLHGRVVVMAADKLAKLYVYQPKEQRLAQMAL